MRAYDSRITMCAESNSGHERQLLKQSSYKFCRRNIFYHSTMY